MADLIDYDPGAEGFEGELEDWDEDAPVGGDVPEASGDSELAKMMGGLGVTRSGAGAVLEPLAADAAMVETQSQREVEEHVAAERERAYPQFLQATQDFGGAVAASGVFFSRFLWFCIFFNEQVAAG